MTQVQAPDFQDITKGEISEVSVILPPPPLKIVPVLDETAPYPVPVPTIAVNVLLGHIFGHISSYRALRVEVFDFAYINHGGVVYFSPPVGYEALVNVAAPEEDMKVLFSVLRLFGYLDIALHKSTALESHIERPEAALTSMGTVV